MFKIVWLDDERFDVYLNGVYLTYADYDEAGSHIMEKIRCLIVNIANDLNLDFHEEGCG